MDEFFVDAHVTVLGEKRERFVEVISERDERAAARGDKTRKSEAAAKIQRLRTRNIR